jgi:hypothetical protein
MVFMALDDDQPLSGAQFARQVGTDPEKWAEAFEQQSQRSIVGGEAWLRTHEGRVEYLAKWFRDAMEAAVKAAHSGDWRQLPSE